MASLTMANCRNGLYTFLNTTHRATVEGAGGLLGLVHKQRRRLQNETDLRTLLGGDRPRGWFIHPAEGSTTVTERQPGHRGIGVQSTTSQDMTAMQWQIDGYLAVSDKDDSEQEATDLAWGLVEALNSYGVIPAVTGAILQLPADIEQFKYAMLGGTLLCHYVVIGVGWHGQIRRG